MKNFKIILSASIIITILFGCSSSRITSTWKADDIKPQHFDKILVLGLIQEKDRNVQEYMENHMVGDQATWVTTQYHH